MTVSVRVLRRRLPYTGAELRSHFALRLLGIEGDSAIAFFGSCDVTPESMVDLVDLRAHALICARLMLHVIVEHFDPNLRTAVLRQRLLVAIARDLLSGQASRAIIERTGDDLFVRRGTSRRKLSISVATVSPVSSLVHFAINVDPTGAPVAAAGLEDLDVEPRAFARELLHRYAAEIDSVESAAVTVRSVP